MRRRVMRATACGLAAALMFTGAGMNLSAASVSDANVQAGDSDTLTAGVSLAFTDYMTAAIKAETVVNDTPVVAEARTAEQALAEPSPYADIAIAQVNNYVNVRSEANEESEILGKLYNNSAATVHETVDGWYRITSGTVTGYVKCEYVVVGDEELAKSVSRRYAIVNEDTETLFVRQEPSTESDKLGMVGATDNLTVTDESVDGWVKVEIEEGEGYVSADYVTVGTEFVQAESKAEEEARLAREEAERKAAAEAAARRAASQSNNSGGGSATYNPPTGGDGAAVAAFACQFVGNPYVYGGTSLTNGADCSGFVMSVYANFGVSLPRTSGSQRSAGYGVSVDQAQPGDIICYSGHVGIYIGGGNIVHASSSSSGIKISPMGHNPILAVRRIF